MTKLRLAGDDIYVNDLAVTAILVMLTRLQWLEAGVDHVAIFPVIGRLKHLRHLELLGLKVDAHVMTQFLGPLEHLTHVSIG